MVQEDTDEASRLAVHGERIRKSGVLGKSQPLIRLFDLLLERSLADIAPKEIEIEIAQIVFGKAADLDLGSDARVRVLIHRLRRKLLDMPADDSGERVAVQRGQYRLVVVPADVAKIESPEVPARAPLRPRQRAWKSGAGLLALLILNATCWLWLAPPASRDSRLDSLLWKGVLNNGTSPLVVLGDQYVFSELSASGAVARVIGDPDIDSRDDLDEYKMHHPDAVDKYVDLNAHHLPEGIAEALISIDPILTGSRPGKRNSMQEIAMSGFKNDMLKSNHIVYLGLLGDMGDLQEPLSDISGFSLAEARSGVLVDRESGHRYQSDWSDPSPNGVMRSDYAYLASLLGPSGSRVLVIAGTPDPALMQSAQIASDANELNRLASRLGSVDAFEALYEVRTFGPSNVSAKLLIARRLNVAPM